MLAYLDASDALIQVLTYEWTSLARARSMAATLAAINYAPQRIRYLLNRADSSSGLPHDALLQTIGRKPDFEVVSDGKLVVEANNRGVTFTSLAPEARISSDVAGIAAALTQAMAPKTAPAPIAGGVA